MYHRQPPNYIRSDEWCFYSQSSLFHYILLSSTRNLSLVLLIKVLLIKKSLYMACNYNTLFLYKKPVNKKFRPYDLKTAEKIRNFLVYLQAFKKPFFPFLVPFLAISCHIYQFSASLHWNKRLLIRNFLEQKCRRQSLNHVKLLNPVL